MVDSKVRPREWRLMEKSSLVLALQALEGRRFVGRPRMAWSDWAICRGALTGAMRGGAADGKVVVGRGTLTNGGEAFRWTQAGGMQGLGDLPGGRFSSVAFATSADGSVVVGYGESPGVIIYNHDPFRWTTSDGMVNLYPGTLLSTNDMARDVSGDGSIVVGSYDNHYA